MTDEALISKKWLERNHASEKEINTLNLKLEQIQAEINNCVKPMEKSEIQNSRNGNSQEIKLAEYADLMTELQKRLAELRSMDIRALNVISKVQNSNERVVLIDRYINRRSWVKIQRTLHVSERTVHRIHSSALNNLYKYIPAGERMEISND